ncbi:hypothetical protein HRR83_007244 [Exophiala dermatitidis]|uniref:N-acetyltransferase domain-containing protein n=1 Tax=Exophiala dermatitidis (strain ATCC 34100 / CBS 525.76 / NIH/UT8656) TaxID=858893 RepID=H6C425_EXODN|nr:uncharacterized protein HMPREF1120_06401 [Exophiala dermatitidis NIH/UT8656]KAJ4509078.1 hypothetical protein HRR75_006047 [Exophiala dermatitidis]EHY58390.1 hypothetical protein HMPREF1120_06401 [Exophiala dermatitidis NIH/UT8656]KAJ4511203.1 hypothetical protein HRR73_006536 [Exophiala dermatitidis]KAJ4545704.1 hypothetical protein HRR78_005978 [Exophiala dermatitidis]KAJ4550931.1 hypothetical protein HRR77_003284 [Exophiala dermatitidis]
MSQPLPTTRSSPSSAISAQWPEAESEITPLLATTSSDPTPTSTSSQPAFTLRYARFADLSPAARTCSLAFWDDVLFGRLIHPHRSQYPTDVDKYWYRRFVVDWWDWSHVFLVTTETVPVKGDGDLQRVVDEPGPNRQATPKIQQKEIITGFAHWSRIAPSWRENYRAGWGLPWWDPRRILKPLFSLIFHHILPFVSPNRAASSQHESIIEQSVDYLDHIWTGERAESWYLECLAVHPAFQRRGQGRALVDWGLEQARKEGIAASVIAADGKERFYQKCGFDVGPVGRSGEGLGNPLHDVPGGLVFFRDKEGVVVKKREVGSWIEGPEGVFDWDGWLKERKKGS